MDRVQAVRQYCEFCGSMLSTAPPSTVAETSSLPYHGQQALPDFPQPDVGQSQAVINLTPTGVSTIESHEGFGIDFDIDAFCSPIGLESTELWGVTTNTVSSDGVGAPMLFDRVWKDITSETIDPSCQSLVELAPSYQRDVLLTPESLIRHSSSAKDKEQTICAPETRLPLLQDVDYISFDNSDALKSITVQPVCWGGGPESQSDYESFLDSLDISPEQKDHVYGCRKHLHGIEGLSEADMRLLELKVTGKEWSWITDKYHQWTGKKRQKATLGMRISRWKNDKREKNKKRSQIIRDLLERGQHLECLQKENRQAMTL